MCMIMTNCTRFQFNEIETFIYLFEVYGSMIHAMRQQFKLLIRPFKSNHCSSHQPSKSRIYIFIYHYPSEELNIVRNQSKCKDRHKRDIIKQEKETRE